MRIIMLEIKNIMYYYKSQKDKVILDHISYDFERGKMYAILGTSGSGKTTLLSLLAGLDVPVEGEVCVNGENILKKGLNAHRKENISLVFQNYNLIDYLTPVENVRLGGKEDAMELLKKMGLNVAESRRNVMQLSGGQQQRVAIARALASNAPILLADEPTGNLDEDTANEIIDIFLNLAHEQDKCVVMVTHSKEMAGKADVILTLKKGIIAENEGNMNNR
jgi:putative ABC transport system ATP-binding protein